MNLFFEKNPKNSQLVKFVMRALDNIYEKPSDSNKVFLRKRLFNTNTSEGGSVVDRLNEFNMITSNLSCLKVNFNDEFRALLIFFSLP